MNLKKLNDTEKVITFNDFGEVQTWIGTERGLRDWKPNAAIVEIKELKPLSFRT